MSPPRHRPCVLVVDPESKRHRTMIAALDARAYDTDTATFAGEALKKLDRDDERAIDDRLICAIVADTKLPDMDGFALLDAVRKRPQRPALTFIFLADDEGVDAKVRAFGLGVDDYITRRRSRAEIADRVTSKIERHALYFERQCRMDEPLPAELNVPAEPPDLAGSLEALSGVELFRMLTGEETGRGKTGALRFPIRVVAQAGVIYFRDGEVYHAISPGQYGRDAFDMAFSQTGCAFDFRAGVVPPVRTIRAGAMDLIMVVTELQGQKKRARAGSEPAKGE